MITPQWEVYQFVRHSTAVLLFATRTLKSLLLLLLYYIQSVLPAVLLKHRLGGAAILVCIIDQQSRGHSYTAVRTASREV